MPNFRPGNLIYDPRAIDHDVFVVERYTDGPGPGYKCFKLNNLSTEATACPDYYWDVDIVDPYFVIWDPFAQLTADNHALQNRITDDEHILAGARRTIERTEALLDEARAGQANVTRELNDLRGLHANQTRTIAELSLDLDTCRSAHQIDIDLRVGLQQRVTDLENQLQETIATGMRADDALQRMTTERDGAIKAHEDDRDTISSALLAAAEEHGLCGKFDTWIIETNPRLVLPLQSRTADNTVTLNVTINRVLSRGLDWEQLRDLDNEVKLLVEHALERADIGAQVILNGSDWDD